MVYNTLSKKANWCKKLHLKKPTELIPQPNIHCKQSVNRACYTSGPPYAHAHIQLGFTPGPTALKYIYLFIYFYLHINHTNGLNPAMHTHIHIYIYIYIYSTTALWIEPYQTLAFF